MFKIPLDAIWVLNKMSWNNLTTEVKNSSMKTFHLWKKVIKDDARGVSSAHGLVINIRQMTLNI